VNTRTSNILLVEDNEAHVELIRRALVSEDKKFNLTVAGTLAEARKILKKNPPDLMIVDYLLPDGKGLELLTGNSNKATFPVAVITGHGDEKIATAAMKAGAIDYIVKSSKMFADVPHIIERFLREWQHITKRKQAEEALIKSEKRNHTWLEHSPVCTKIVNLDFNLQYMSASGVKDLKIDDITEFYGKPYPFHFFPDSFKMLMSKNLKKVKETGEVITQEASVLDIKGNELWYHSTLVPVNDDEGQIDYIIVVSIETTKRKQAEKTLQEEQKQTRQIIDTARDAFVSMDENGIITDWNPCAEALFGWHREEALGRLMSEIIIPEEFREAHTTGLKHYLATGEGPVFNQHIEITALHRDGRTIPVELSIVSVHSDDTINFNAFIRDISGRVHAQKTLEKSHKQLRTSLIGTVVAVSRAVGARDPYTAGHQQRVSQLARAIAQEMELDAEQIEGLRLGAIIHDIGKIYLPAEILSKPTKLTDVEYALIKSHAQVGYDILKDIAFPWPVADIAYQHHERLDGSGYPQGLKGDEICLEARIVAVADVVEAMSSHRPYRTALGMDAALEEIEIHRGKWFAPVVVDACLTLCREKGFTFE